MDAIIGAVGLIVGALLSGRFVSDRPGRRRREIAELLELQAATPQPAQAVLTSLIARKWALLLVPRPWTRRLIIAIGLTGLATAACSFVGLGFARSARVHYSQAVTHLQASDRLSNASQNDSLNGLAGLTKNFQAITAQKPTARQTAIVNGLVSQLRRSAKEGQASTKEFTAARASTQAANSQSAIASDLANSSIGLAIFSGILLLVTLPVVRREFRDLLPKAEALEKAIRLNPTTSVESTVVEPLQVTQPRVRWPSRCRKGR